MRKRFCISVVFCLLVNWVFSLPVDTAMTRNTPTDSLQIDTVQIVKYTRSDFSLLDSFRNYSSLRSIAFPYETIKGMAITEDIKFESRTLPGVKEIEFRKKRDETWKFWVLIAIIFFVASVRLMNIKRFDEIISSAFDMSFDLKVWLEKSPNY
ncbi:MAG: hypothetical protein ACOVP1_09085, partial [Bacteroidia bacterium]